MDLTLLEFAKIELIEKNKSVRVEELVEVDELLRRKHAKEAAKKELKEFVKLQKSAMEMPSHSKLAKSSWWTEEKIRHRIEFLEAYAIDKHYILPQNNNGGARGSLIVIVLAGILMEKLLEMILRFTVASKTTSYAGLAGDTFSGVGRNLL
ncbi:putative exoribonuclease II [Forsythia ovata]|uniref:Exoribonuclease II n=1 Tax=Forsythia ovata TaxID=205694 RepID=A0ABD1S5V9_9LAMI